jgi:ergothioneine biosynthesis protein EgtB
LETQLNPPITYLSAKTIEEHYKNIRNQTVTLCKPLKTEDYVVQPIVDVSPPKWHLGHTTWFFEYFVLKQFKKNYKEFNPDFPFVFNSYYESMGEKIFRAHRGNLSRPSTEEVYQYRNFIDTQMHDLLQSVQDDEANQELFRLIELGIHHEQQHQELLVTDIKYILGNNPLLPVYLTESQHPDLNAAHTNGHTLHQEYLEIEGGLYHIGFKGEGFHYDNEEGYHQVYLHDYRLLNRLITNEEYLAFMEAGGYEDVDLWLSDGWEYIQQNQIKAPAYWHKIDNAWHYFTLYGLQLLETKAPVTHISYYEAEAYARWSGKRLPTEFEWETACQLSGYSTQNFDVLAKANMVESGSYRPVSAAARGTDTIAAQMIGDVWEWTESAYLPYPFYQRAKGALGEYNGKFMVNQMVLRGGSCATPRSHIRPTYRNFFQADKRWQFTGIRLAENI